MGWKSGRKNRKNPGRHFIRVFGSRGPMATLLLYWHTLRHLKFVQVWARLRYKLHRPQVDRSPPPSLAQSPDTWVQPFTKLRSMFEPDVFCFLNQEHRLLPQQWDNPQLDRLWRYNLHYFDDLVAQDASDRNDWHRNFLTQWVQENPPVVGTGWEPYPTSLRIINWVKWSFAGNSLPSECVQSLALQVRWLSRRLEYHILGNHLFSNAKALVFSSTLFDGREADQWMEKGMKILALEIPEQILTDGGHFERSTMYHALALEDMLDLINLASAFPDKFIPWQGFIESWLDIVRKMVLWLKAMEHPDGEISFFNDSTMGIAAHPAELYEYCSRLGISIPEVADQPLT